MADVHATVAMARLIKQHQPRLFEYYFNLRQKKKVRAMLEPYTVNSHLVYDISARIVYGKVTVS